jgi:hypothetical protein
VDLAPEILAALPAGAGLDISYEPAATQVTNQELGDISFGRVHPLRAPIRLHVRTEDAATGTDVALAGDAAGEIVSVRLPVLGAALSPDGEFTWLAEVRQDGQFLGYKRLDTSYDPDTNSLTTWLSLGELNDRLLLPVRLAPTFATETDPAAHLWSSAFADADDFGQLSQPDTLLQIVGPQLGGRLYVFDAASATYGWIDAGALAPLQLPFTP